MFGQMFGGGGGTDLYGSSAGGQQPQSPFGGQLWSALQGIPLFQALGQLGQMFPFLGQLRGGGGGRDLFGGQGGSSGAGGWGGWGGGSGSGRDLYGGQ